MYCCPTEEPLFLPRVLEKAGEIFSNTFFAGFVFVVAAGCVALGIYGLIARDTEFDLIWFIPEDSTPYQFTVQQREYFNAPARVALYVEDIDYYANQDKMNDLHQTALTSKYLDISWGLEDWHHDFLTWAGNGTLNSDQLSTSGNPKTIIGEDLYYSSLQTWLKGSGQKYEQNILWKSNNNRIKASKIETEFNGIYVAKYGNERYDAMVNLRSEISAAAPTAFAFAYDFLYWEEFGIIKRELIRNVIIAMIVIFIVVFCLIQDKRTAICTMTAIQFAIIDVAGFATFWDLTYNGVTTIYTLIALGLSVDYSIHIGYKFSTTPGTSKERVMNTMKYMGPPVLHGSLSTLIAVMSLAGAKTFIFQTFFRMFVLVGTLGAAHGLIVLPCLLFMFGGDNVVETKSEENQGVEVAQIKSSKMSV